MGHTDSPPGDWARFKLAQFLNAAMGTTHITPWNLGDIPEHWIALIVYGNQIQCQLAENGLLKEQKEAAKLKSGGD